MRIRIFFCLVLLVYAGSARAQTEKLVDDWIQRDLAAMKLIPALVQRKYTDPEDVAKILGARTYPSPDELGFGASRFEVSQGYGYSGIEVSAFVYRGKVVRYRVLFGDSTSWAQARSLMIAAWRRDVGLPFQENEDSIYHEIIDEVVLTEYKTEIGKELGPQTQTKIPRSLRDEYEYLLSPYENSIVGIHGCGAGGVLPIGKGAIDSLVRERRYDLIENVLRGFNPGGRVYALMELKKIEKAGKSLKPSMLKSMESVAEIEVPLRVCTGGVVFMRTTAEILRELM